MSNIQISKPKIIPSQSSSKKRSIGAFARTAALATGLALVSSSALNAQIKQIWFPKDSSQVIFKYLRSSYSSDKKEMNQTPDSIEFLGGFEIDIPKYPRANIKLNESISISAAEQKDCFVNPFVENDKHVFFYSPPVYMDGIKVYPGGLDVFKKITPQSNTSSQEKD